MSTAAELLEQLLGSPHAHAIEDHHDRLGDATVRIDREHVVPFMTGMRSGEGFEFDMLVDLCAVDYLGEQPRFEVVYHLYSVRRNHRLRVKARVPEDDASIDSVTGIWPAAGWMEREVWDLYGVRFAGHGDLRRILLYEEFEGHPLRKDYAKQRRQPLVGPGD